MDVTALIVTYNHAPFIADAIESVLMQDSAIDFEIVVSEDCSEDGTGDIVRNYERRYPDRVRAIFSPRNLNDNSVITRGLCSARGRYIAMLDGDDYWTSRQKLWRQVQFLDQRPDCAICFHRAALVGENGVERLGYYPPTKPSRIATIERIIENNFIATSTAMLRKTTLSSMPPWYVGCRFGDWPLYILGTRHGYIGYIDEVWARYRIHGGGAWRGAGSRKRIEDLIEFQKELNAHLGFQYDEIIQKRIVELYRDLSMDYVRSGDRRQGKVYFAERLKVRPLLTNFSDLETLKLALKIYAPRLARLAQSRWAGSGQERY